MSLKFKVYSRINGGFEIVYIEKKSFCKERTFSPQSCLGAWERDGWSRSSLCKESGKEGAESGEEMGLHLKDKKPAEKIDKEGAENEQSTSSLPPSLVSKVQEGDSSEIACR